MENLTNRQQLEKAFNSALNAHRMSIIDNQQGLPCNELPMDCALTQEGFTENEATLVANCNNAAEAANAIQELREAFNELIEDTANDFYSLSRDANHEMNQEKIRQYITKHCLVISHPSWSGELTKHCLDLYFE